MYAQVDEEGRQYNNIMKEIIDHRKYDKALPSDDGYVTVRSKRHPIQTTKGWQLCIKCCNGSTSWEDLKDLKEAPYQNGRICHHSLPRFGTGLLLVG
jgi:hypothetical protein